LVITLMTQVLPVLVRLAAVSPLEMKIQFSSSQINLTVHLKIFKRKEKCILTLQVCYQPMPQISQSKKPPGSARILTNEESLLILRDKEQKKKQREIEKAQRKRSMRNNSKRDL